MPVQVALERTLGGDLVRQARFQAARGLDLARPRPGVAAVQQDHHLGVVVGHLGDQDRQLLVRQVVAAGAAAVVADQPFVLAVREGLAERRARGPARPVAAELEQRDIAGPRLTEVRPEAPDDVGAGGLVVLQDLDREHRRADLPAR